MLNPAAVHAIGHKQQLQWFRSYIAAVLSTPSQQGSAPTHLFQVFDLRNKLIATSVPLTEVCLPGMLLSLTFGVCLRIVDSGMLDCPAASVVLQPCTVLGFIHTSCFPNCLPHPIPPLPSQQLTKHRF